MKVQNTLALVVVAGCACTVASAQVSDAVVTVVPRTVTVSKDAPKIISITRLTTGETIYFPRNDRFPGHVVNAFDSFTGPCQGTWNLPWDEGAGYSSGNGSVNVFPWSEDPNCMVFGGNWSGGASPVTGNVTDVVFNVYAADPDIWPGALSTINNVTRVEISFALCNTETTGGVPDSRINNFNVLFCDRNGIFVDGFMFSQALDPGDCFVWPTSLDLSGVGGIDIPGEGFMIFDEVGAEPPATSGDCGFALVPAGGFIVGGVGMNPAPVGSDLVAIPDADGEILAADQVGFRDTLDSNWFFQATADADPCADGNCADTTYTDLKLGPNAVNWAFTVSSGDGLGDYELPHTMPFALGGAFDPKYCEADLTGSVDSMSLQYGVPDALLDSRDFFYYLDLFVVDDRCADLTGSLDPNNAAFGVPDSMIDARDFFYYLALYECCNAPPPPGIPVVCHP